MRRCDDSQSSVFECVKAHSERRVNAKNFRLRKFLKRDRDRGSEAIEAQLGAR
jgi:hypothetical protein